ncbi:MAG: MltA domain-containing protein [Alphaproteobacteria bacterium]|nr:MltA domain-containing protein [Alphaproteobacteria bacterium]
MTGWEQDRLAAAVAPFLASCMAIAAKPDAAPLDPVPTSGDFGTVAEWRPLCRAAALLPTGDDAAARRFFADAFVPTLAGSSGTDEGLFTGYYEVQLTGSRRRESPYQTPIYRRPADPTRYSRGEIEAGALSGRGLELLWVDDPIDAFLLHVQGSGQVKLHSGGTVRIGYDGRNGRPFVPIGHLLVERGILPPEGLTMAGIRRWMVRHPAEAAVLRRENPSFIFFREVTGSGPIGSENVVLTPERSLAVDRAFIPLGVPLWIDAEQRYSPEALRRLVIAQDTGGAIKGAVRGDLFWGAGETAALRAGATNARGHYYLLLPRTVAARRFDAGI